MNSLRSLLAASGAAVVLGMAPGALAQVANGGFEVGDADLFFDFDYYPNTFDAWTNVPSREFTDPIFMEMDPAFVHSGSAACKIFGQFNGTPNASLVTQQLPATPGHKFQLDVWSLHSSADPIMGSSAGFVTITFLNASNAVLNLTTHDVTNAASLQDMYIEKTFTATAPAGATKAQIELGYFQLNNAEGGSTFYDDANLLDLGVNTTLVNESFDTYVPTSDYQPDACCIPGWERPGGNAFINRTMKRTGNSALIMYGQFNGFENVTTVYQDLPVAVTPGDLLEASSWAGHLAGDTLAGTNVAFMNLEMRDASDNLLTVTSIDMLSAGSPAGSFLQGVDTATVPAGATTARIVLGLYQGLDQAAGAVYFDDTSLASLGPNTSLVNPGFDTYVPDPITFEPDPTEPLPGWGNFGFNGGISPTVPNIGHAEPGASGKQLAAYMFGQFPGDNSANTTVIYQDLPVSSGEHLKVDSKVKQNAGDTLGPDNSLTAIISWLNASDAEISVSSTVALTAVSPSDVFIPTSVEGTAPAGAVTARVGFVYTQVNEGGGAAIIDDVVATLTPPPPCPGDIDGNGTTDVFDFSIFSSNFGHAVTPFTNGDLDGDGNVTVFDFAIFSSDFGCAP